MLGGETFGRWLGHEGGTLLMGLVPSQKRQRAPSPFPSSEDTGRRRCLQPGRGTSSAQAGPWSHSSSFHKCEKYISVVYKPLSLWYDVTAAPNSMRQILKSSLPLCPSPCSAASLFDSSVEPRPTGHMRPSWTHSIFGWFSASPPSTRTHTSFHLKFYLECGDFLSSWVVSCLL